MGSSANAASNNVLQSANTSSAAAPVPNKLPHQSSTPLKFKNKWLGRLVWGGTALVLTAAAVIVIISIVNSRNKSSNADLAAVKTVASGLSPTTIDLSGIKVNAASLSGQQVNVNGLLNINNQAVLTPTTRPTNPTTGQIYLDKTDNTVYFYNGTVFIPMGATATNSVTNLNGLTGGLNITGSNGIGVNSTGGTIGLSLPSNLIVQGSNPTFTGLTLSSLAANGAVVTDGASNLNAVTGIAGDCLISGVGPGGQPGFASCSSAGTSTTINGGFGAVTLANATNPIGFNGTITIDNAAADGTTKGIATFNASNFSSAGGVINTIQGINFAASPQFTGLKLTGLAAHGVLIGEGAGAIISVADTSTPGRCLISTGADPIWSGCAGGGGGSGVDTVGAYDTQPAVADGAQIIGTTIFFQSASALFPGMVNTGTQTFAGAKTFDSIILQGGGTLAGTAAPGQLAVPNETGKVCSSDLTTTSTDPLNPSYDTCYDKYASASGSAAGYIQFAPGKVQQDHTCDGVDPCDHSTIFVGKTNTTGYIMRLQGWCTDTTNVCPTGPQLQDVLTLQGNGDLQFTSLQQSDTAFTLSGNNTDILTVSTKPPSPAFGCVVDFESSKCIDGTNLDWQDFLPFDEVASSPTTARSLSTTVFKSSTSSLQVNNGTRISGATDAHGVYLPYHLNYNQRYSISYYVDRTNKGTAGFLIRFGYYRKAPSPITGSPYEAGAERTAPPANGAKCSASIPTKLNTFKFYTCSFTITNSKTGAQTDADGMWFRLDRNNNLGQLNDLGLDGTNWNIDDVTFVKGDSTSTFTNFTTLGTPLLVNPDDYDHALTVSDSDNPNFFVADSFNRQVTITRNDNQSASIPALKVTSDKGSAACFGLGACDSTHTLATVVLQDAFGQTANTLTIQNSSGSDLGGFDAGGHLVLYPSACTAGSCTNSATIKAANNVAGAKSYLLPNFSGGGGSTTICTSSGNCNGAGNGGATLQDAYDASAGGSTPEIMLNQGGDIGAIDIQDSNPASGDNLLNLWASGVDITVGTPLLSVGPTGATQFQNANDSSVALVVNNSGGTGVFSVDTSTGKIHALNGVISPSIENDSGGFSSQLVIAAPSSNHVITIPNTSVGPTDEVCLKTTGNCVGASGAVSTSGGSANFIPKYTSASALTASHISDDGTTVTIQGGSGGLALGDTSSSVGQLTIYNGVNVNGVTIAQDPSNRASTPRVIYVPNAGGTLCTTVNINTCVGSGSGAGTAFVQGGNDFGSGIDGTLGLTNATSGNLLFLVRNANRLTLDTGGKLNLTNDLVLNGSATLSGTSGSATLQAKSYNPSLTSGVGGGVAINAGNSGIGLAGNVDGGTITLQAGNGGASTGSEVGGAVRINGGVGGITNTGTSTGGAIVLQGGNGGANGAGGAIQLTAGDGNGTNSSGGTLSLDSGAKNGTGTSTINFGVNNARTINIGNTASTLALQGSSITVATASHGILDIGLGGTGSSSIINIGGNTSASGTPDLITIQGNTGAAASAGGEVDIIGGTPGSGATTGGLLKLQGGASNGIGGSLSGSGNVQISTFTATGGSNSNGGNAGGLGITLGNAGSGAGTNMSGGSPNPAGFNQTITNALGTNVTYKSQYLIQLGSGGSATGTGTAATGGNFLIQGGSGGNSTGTTGQTAGAGSTINLFGGNGGNETGGTGINNGGNGGGINLVGGTGGSTATGLNGGFNGGGGAVTL